MRKFGTFLLVAGAIFLFFAMRYEIGSGTWGNPDRNLTRDIKAFLADSED